MTKAAGINSSDLILFCRARAPRTDRPK
jgi:hypothetical protein